MAELTAKHHGRGRWSVQNEAGDTVSGKDWLSRESANKLIGEGVKPPRPNRNKGRRERVTFGKMRSKLSLDASTVAEMERLGKVARWVNDEDAGTRVKSLYERGYDFWAAKGDEVVGDPDGGYQPPSEGSHMRKHVGMGKDGQPMYAYLMVTDEENYQEDAAAKEAVNMQVDDAIRGGDALEKHKGGMGANEGTTSVKEVKYTP